MEPKIEKDIHSIIFDSISDGVFTTDNECRITSFNRAAEEISGFKRHEAIGKYCFDIFRTDICQTHCALRDTLSSGKQIANQRVTIINRYGQKIPISVSTTILKDSEGNLLGAVEFFKDLTTIERLQEQLSKSKPFHCMVSNNVKMQKLFELLPEIAQSECNVLIQGPSGSGKELIAQAIHNLSPRRQNAYIRLNCAALPETLLESELFGYVRGAFTDAKRDKPGHFSLANGGTILLDEIGDMPMTLQVKLLRVLNNGEFQPLGSTKTLHTDARIITSSNQDIEAMVREGAFREDLYYRVNVITIEVPPLKQRLEDLPILIDHFIKRFNKKTGKHISGISADVLQTLRKYDFPGNVRELENAIEHAFVLCQGTTIELNHLPQKMLNGIPEPKDNGRQFVVETSSEQSIIIEALKRHGGNKSRTAEELGMHRTTLWRKMVRYGLA